MITIVSDCYENGVCFRFLENNVSTEGDFGVGVVNTLIAVYHAERDRFIEKEKEASVYINKTQRKHSMKVNQAIELIIKNKSCKTAMEEAGISRATYFRLKKHTLSE